VHLLQKLLNAPSTTMQYRWAWSQFARFCSRDGIEEYSEEAGAAFVDFVAAEHRAGRFKDWKHKLLRKAVLVLTEVARTGSYQWCLSRQAHPNDALNAVFHLVEGAFQVALNHANCGSARHDSWCAAVAFTRTTSGSLGSQYSFESVPVDEQGLDAALVALREASCLTPYRRAAIAVSRLPERIVVLIVARDSRS